MKNLTNILSKVVILAMIFVMAIPTVAFAGMTNDSNLKHYEERYEIKYLLFFI